MGSLIAEPVPGLALFPEDLAIASAVAMGPVAYMESALVPGRSLTVNRERPLRTSVPEVPARLIMAEVNQTMELTLPRLTDLEAELEATVVPVSAHSAEALEMEDSRRPTGSVIVDPVVRLVLRHRPDMEDSVDLEVVVMPVSEQARSVQVEMVETLLQLVALEEQMVVKVSLRMDNMELGLAFPVPTMVTVTCKLKCIGNNTEQLFRRKKSSEII